MNATFTCDACGGTFPKAWSDDEAAAEASERYTEQELQSAGVICDDCWRAAGFDTDPRPT